MSVFRYETGSMIAFASGTHRRLGAGSWTLHLTAELVELIFACDPLLIQHQSVRLKQIKWSVQVPWHRPLRMVPMGLLQMNGWLEEDMVYSNQEHNQGPSRFRFKLILGGQGRRLCDSVIYGCIPQKGRYEGNVQYVTSVIWHGEDGHKRIGLLTSFTTCNAGVRVLVRVLLSPSPDPTLSDNNDQTSNNDGILIDTDVLESQTLLLQWHAHPAHVLLVQIQIVKAVQPCA